MRLYDSCERNGLQSLVHRRQNDGFAYFSLYSMGGFVGELSEALQLSCSDLSSGDFLRVGLDSKELFRLVQAEQRLA